MQEQDYRINKSYVNKLQFFIKLSITVKYSELNSSA